jgi:hypothetical protein
MLPLVSQHLPGDWYVPGRQAAMQQRIYRPVRYAVGTLPPTLHFPHLSAIERPVCKNGQLAINYHIRNLEYLKRL